MPDKTLKVVTYAAGASLAAITLIYVFGPTYFLDSDTSSSLGGAFSTRKKGIVGLENPANDCFINSVLQALAGLGDLRLYLIREVHRRSLDDGSIYSQLVPPAALAGEEGEAAPVRFGKDIPAWKLEGLQRGSVTKGLKEILDALNERPIYKKTISAAPFVRTLEEAFRQRVSRQQQDAQEFLQVVAERLCDEYHAGRRARLFATRTATVDDCWPSRTSNHGGATGSASPIAASQHVAPDLAREGAVGSVEDVRGFEKERRGEDEEGFPLQGRVESQIECLTCGFTPRPTASTFCTLTLHVPQVPATTLGACFDGMFKTEYIDDFKCEKCRLLHALALFESDEQRSASEAVRRKARAAVESLRAAIETDPENPPRASRSPTCDTRPGAE
ncbi:d33d9bf9-5ad3-4087-8222-7a7aa9a1a497 [Thermothielavioides terrestris]|uniref:D33d9bf9-5ad3-4087-8222-7a7aa9a1a497 n=1 Tax=Thermothielavioides terrestris TaxID=2587410 RepID=A0A446B950_9PEZI|nr:d33d9bf9-5ad3-4087-8222-7a7aa9a1a497 [Thermothielavioides terrestris]